MLEGDTQSKKWHQIFLEKNAGVSDKTSDQIKSQPSFEAVRQEEVGNDTSLSPDVDSAFYGDQGSTIAKKEVPGVEPTVQEQIAHYNELFSQFFNDRLTDGSAAQARREPAQRKEIERQQKEIVALFSQFIKDNPGDALALIETVGDPDLQAMLKEDLNHTVQHSVLKDGLIKRHGSFKSLREAVNARNAIKKEPIEESSITSQTDVEDSLPDSTGVPLPDVADPIIPPVEKDNAIDEAQPVLQEKIVETTPVVEERVDDHVQVEQVIAPPISESTLAVDSGDDHAIDQTAASSVSRDNKSRFGILRLLSRKGDVKANKYAGHGPGQIEIKDAA